MFFISAWLSATANAHQIYTEGSAVGES